MSLWIDKKAENYIKHQTDIRSLSIELKWELGYLLLQWVIEHPASEATVDDFGFQLPQVRPCETLSVHLDNVHRRRHNQKNTVAEHAGQGYVICQTVSTFEKGILWNCQISCFSTITQSKWFQLQSLTRIPENILCHVNTFAILHCHNNWCLQETYTSLVYVHHMAHKYAHKLMCILMCLYNISLCPTCVSMSNDLISRGISAWF